MELKPGYKQTEVGVIPEDWTIKSAGNIVLSDTPICYGVVQVGNYDDAGIPIVAIKFVKDIENAPLHRTSLALEKPYARSRVKAGDVLISIKGTIGRIGIVPEGFEGNISRDLARLRLSKDFSPTYIAHQFENKTTQQRIMRSVVGTTRLEFSIATLRQFKLPVPSTKIEQEEIAKALSDIDNLLGVLDRLITKKQNLKQSAMQELFTGKKRLPGFSGEWEETTLENLGTSQRPPIKAGPFGSSLKKSFYVKKGYKIYGQEQVIAGNFSIGNYYIDKKLFESLKSCEIKPNDILISLVGTFGKSVVVPRDIEPGIINPRLIRLSLDSSKVFSYFIQYCFLSSKTQQLLSQISQGGTMGIINVNTLKLLPINLPTLPEQKAIANILSDMDTEIAALKKRRDKTQNIKQAMMQELLTGKTRLI